MFVFRYKRRELMWTAFRYYILSVFMYCVPVWCLLLQRDINLLKSGQKSALVNVYGVRKTNLVRKGCNLSALSFCVILEVTQIWLRNFNYYVMTWLQTLFSHELHRTPEEVVLVCSNNIRNHVLRHNF